MLPTFSIHSILGIVWWVLFTKTELCIPIPKHGCNVRSKIWWFTESCNSHYVSHFAAFFIVQGAKRSIVKRYGLFKLQHEVAKYLTYLVLVKGVLWEPPLVLAAKTHNTKSFTKYVSEKTIRNDAMCFCKRKFTSRMWVMLMILPQVHLRKPCYDFSFL